MRFLFTFLFVQFFTLSSLIAFAKKPEAAPTVEKSVQAPVETAKEVNPAPVATETPAATTTATLATPSTPTVQPPAVQGLIPIDFQSGLSKLAEATLGGVVNISTTQVINGRGGPLAPGGEMPRMAPGSPFDELFRDFFGQMEQTPRKVQSLGSGFIIRIQNGKAYIVTNYHVVADAKKITVTLNNRVEIDAVLHGKDERTDLAVLAVDLTKIPVEKHPHALDWGLANAPRVGHFVAAIGNAFGLGNTLTFGLISFKGRDLMARKHDYVDDFIQHTAPINVGNSGGPLLNMDGKVIGINTAIFTPTGGHVGIGFSIPSELAQKTVDALIEHGRVKRGWLGLRIQPVENVQSTDTRERTIIVGGVTAGGPCDGLLKQGDFILKFNGITLDYDNRLTRLVGETAPGTSVTLEVSRKGENKPIVVSVVVGESPETPKAEVAAAQHQNGKKAEAVDIPLLGMSVRENADPKGLVIEKIDELSPAKDVGLQPRDIITEANRTDVKKPDDLNKTLKSLQESGGQTILMCVRRGAGTSLANKNPDNPATPKEGTSNEDEGIFFVSVKLVDELKKTNEEPLKKDEEPKNIENDNKHG